MIDVKLTRDSDPMHFSVAVTTSGSTTRYDVSLSCDDYVRLSQGTSPEALVEAAFRFLLDHEPKESILQSFDVSIIGSYFPQFEAELPRYFT